MFAKLLIASFFKYPTKQAKRKAVEIEESLRKRNFAHKWNEVSNRAQAASRATLPLDQDFLMRLSFSFFRTPHLFLSLSF